MPRKLEFSYALSSIPYKRFQASATHRCVDDAIGQVHHHHATDMLSHKGNRVGKVISRDLRDFSRVHQRQTVCVLLQSLQLSHLNETCCT